MIRSQLVLYTALLITGCFSSVSEKTGLEGKPMPSFKLLLVDSMTIDTKDLPTSKPTVLFYFGPHCPYSVAQMEEILENMNQLKDIDFYAFTVWSFAEMKEFYNRFKLYKYPNIRCGIDYKSSFENIFQARGVPYVAIYGRDRRLNGAFIGKIRGSQIKQVAED